MYLRLKSRKSRSLIWSQQKYIIRLFIEISSLFLKALYKQKSEQYYQIISWIFRKNISKQKLSKQKLSKQNIQDKSQVILTVSSSSIFFKGLHGFSKRQSKMATFNGQPSTANLTVNHSICLNYSTFRSTKYLCRVISW